MGLRTAITKLFTPATPPTRAEPPAQQAAAAARTAMEQAGMGSATPFTPGQPIGPFNGYSTTPRSHDFQTGYNIAARPRHNERVSFGALQGLIDSYDFAQICIWHRIDSIRSMSWSLVPVDDWTGNVDAERAYARRILNRPDRKTAFKPWLARWLYDILAYDAGCLYRLRNNAGRVIGLKHVDGTTIAPLIDDWGGRPDSPAPAFVQFAQGVPFNWLTEQDLVYEPFRPSTTSPYGRAPIESILLNANTDLRLQTYFLQQFTDGNIPEGFAESPEGWSPDQIEAFQDQWDALLYGDQSKQHQIRWVPHGTAFAWTNEKAFSDVQSLFLARKTLAAYHVVPSDLGLTEDVNKATAGTQVDVQERIGDLPLVDHIQGVIDGFLQEDLVLPLRMLISTSAEKEDRLQEAQTWQVWISSGVASPDEAREKVLGLPVDSARPIPRGITSSRLGFIPFDAILAVAGPVNPETAAPDEALPPPATPFDGTPGLLPYKPPGGAEFRRAPIDPDDPQRPATEVPDEATAVEQPAVSAPAVKAAGKDTGKDTGAAAKEIAAFRRFTTGRQRTGSWRDFQFRHAEPRTARSLNEAGRALLRKQAGQIDCAGLAVIAADTGRVLLLQRALDDTDPASGMWEFPGGHLEDGETPWQAAWREWQEETGRTPPAGQQTATWTAPSGTWQGFAYTIPAETDLPADPRGGRILNPDDPDGDHIETAAWFDPADLPAMPALRPEMLSTPWQLLAPPPLPAPPLAKASWRDEPPVPAGLHRVDLPLTDHWAPKVTGALHSLWTGPQVHDAVLLKGAATGPPDRTPEDIADQARALLGMRMSTADLEQAIRGMWTDGWAAGNLAGNVDLANATASPLGAGVRTAWDNWKPGDPEAALHVDMSQVGALGDPAATAQGIAGTLAGQVAAEIGRGVAAGHPVDTIAAKINAIIGDPSRAEMIAHTETARAVTASTLNTYSHAGIGQWDWIISAGACPTCVAGNAADPHPVGEQSIPAHPRCRCAASPVIPNTATPVPAASTAATPAQTGTPHMVTAHMLRSADSDQLAAELGGLYRTAPDSPYTARIEAELDRRDRITQAKQTESDAQSARILQLIDQGVDPAEAESEVTGTPVTKIRRRDATAQLRAEYSDPAAGFEQLARRKFAEYVARAWETAEDATRGNMLSKTGQKAASSITDLWTRPEVTARKWSSPEMLEWFDQHGRITFQQVRDGILDGTGNSNWTGPDFLQ